MTTDAEVCKETEKNEYSTRSTKGTKKSCQFLSSVVKILLVLFESIEIFISKYLCLYSKNRE